MKSATADSLLAIDIGNTRIGMAVSDGDGLHDTQRVAVAEPPTWKRAIEETWAATGGSGARAVVIGSVRPQTTREIVELVTLVCDVDPIRVRDDLPLPMPLDIDNPAEVGVDRVCAAAAAYERVREACAVASVGTALTIDCVSREGRFMGGTILPGLDMAFAALHERTAALPRVRVRDCASPFGRNTDDAIAAGVLYGAVGALREIVERFATELGAWPNLVLTGGNAALLARHADFVDSVVPDLCLMGVALAYRRAHQTAG